MYILYIRTRQLVWAVGPARAGGMLVARYECNDCYWLVPGTWEE